MNETITFYLVDSAAPDRRTAGYRPDDDDVVLSCLVVRGTVYANGREEGIRRIGLVSLLGFSSGSKNAFHAAGDLEGSPTGR